MALCVRNTARHSTTFDLDNTWVMSCFRVHYIHRNVYVKKKNREVEKIQNWSLFPLHQNSVKNA